MTTAYSNEYTYGLATFRVKLDYSKSDTNTASTFSYTATMQMKGEAVFSTAYRIYGSFDGNVTYNRSTITGTGVISKSSWYSLPNPLTVSKTFDRSTSSVAKELRIGAAFGAYSSGTESDIVVSGINSNPKISFTVPALASYSITYNANGGSGAPASQTKYYGKTLTLTSTKPTRTGYTFSKWNTKSDGSGTNYSAGASYTANAAATMYAIWTANTWYVKYNGNGSTSGSMSNSTHTYNTAKNLTANAFSRAYTVTYNHNYSGSTNATATATYSFSTWNTKSDGTGTSYSNQASVKNLTSTAGGTVNLYARWTSASVSLRTPSSRSGYAFGGWYKEAACTNKVGNAGASYTPTANITFYAKWTVNICTISYNANGGSGAPASQTKTFDVALTLSTTKPTRADCKFLGWATSSTATTATYQPGDTLPANVNTATTLYAVWESVPKITSLTAIRCDSGGTQDDEGTYAKVTADWSVNSAVNSATSGTAKLYNGTTEVTSGKTGTWSGSSGGTATAIVSGMSVDNQYTFKFQVTNGSSTASRTVILTRAFFTMDFKSGGNGVGIFSAAPSDGLIVGKATTIFGSANVNGHIITKVSNIDRDGSAPSGTTYSTETMRLHDVDGEALLTIDAYKTSSGTIATRLVTFNEYNSTGYYEYLTMAKPQTDKNYDGSLMWYGKNFVIRDFDLDRDAAAPSSDQYGTYIYFRDKDDETLGYIQTYRDTSGNSGLKLYGANEVNGSGVTNGLTMFVRSDGTRGVAFSEVAPWRAALGLGTSGALPITIAQGGTGATTAAAALANFHVGDMVSASSGSTAVSTAKETYVDLCNFTLAAGTWAVFATFEFATNTTGRRVACINTTAGGTGISLQWRTSGAPVTGGATRIKLAGVLQPSASTKYYLTSWQNSGGALNVIGTVQAVRIK